MLCAQAVNHQMGRELAGMRATISGAGNVAQYTARSCTPLHVPSFLRRDSKFNTTNQWSRLRPHNNIIYDLILKDDIMATVKKRLSRYLRYFRSRLDML